MKLSLKRLLPLLAVCGGLFFASPLYAQDQTGHGDSRHAQPQDHVPGDLHSGQGRSGQAGQGHEVHAGQGHEGQGMGGGHGLQTHGQVTHTGTTETHSAEVEVHHPLEPINWTDFYGTDHEGKPQFPMLALFINLAALLALYKFFPGLLGVVAAIFTDGKTVPEFLKARRKSIGDAIVNAQKLLKEAKGRAARYQSQLENLDADAKNTREGMQEAGRAEKERIVAEAEDKVRRLHKDATFLLDQEQKQMQEDLLKETVERAVLEAEKLLRAKVTSADQERLAEEFLLQIAARRASVQSLAPAPRPLTGDAE